MVTHKPNYNTKINVLFSSSAVKGPAAVQATAQLRASLTGEKVLPVQVGKQQSFKSRLQAGGFQANQATMPQQEREKEQVEQETPKSNVPQDRIKQIH